MLFYCRLLFSVVLFSCAATNSVSKKITIKSGQIPPQMAQEKFVLIGKLYDRKSYDKHVEEAFSSYTGDHVLATEKEIDSRYADRTRYRYIIQFFAIIS